MGRSDAASGMILDEDRGSQGTDLPSLRARSLTGVGGRPDRRGGVLPPSFPRVQRVPVPRSRDDECPPSDAP